LLTIPSYHKISELNINNKILVLYIILGSICVLPAWAQKKVKLERAEKLEGGKKDGLRFDSFSGEVIFLHQDATIYCDSAVLFRKKNDLEAYGNVRIEDGDSISITSNRLMYDGNAKIARLRGNVVFEKRGQMKLYTDFLDYDRVSELATYYNGGKIVDSTNELSSLKGYYEVRKNMASFKTNVIGKHPDYTLKSDTLQYSTETKIIYFRDKTELTDVEGNIFVYESGTFNTLVERSDFSIGIIESDSYYLNADKMTIDDIKGYYAASGRVKMISKNDDVIVLGDKAEYWKSSKITKIYEEPLLKIISNMDTIYVSADTLVSVDDDLEKDKRLLAYPNVRIFKNDLQGRADSLVYFQSDSILALYGDPVLWTQGNQMTSDVINIEIANKTISKLQLVANAFVISKDSLNNFNQIKGREMEAVFLNQELSKVYVSGNGESLFFMLDESDSILIGMNKILCSDMTLNFIDNQLNDITFYTDNDGSFIPPHELKEPDKRLTGFTWREDEKPGLEDVVPVKYLDRTQVSKIKEKYYKSGTSGEPEPVEINKEGLLDKKKNN